MALTALIASSLIAALGVVGLLAPARLIALLQTLESRTGLYVAATIRVAIGVVFYLAADASRAPLVMGVIGVFAIFAGLATPFFGLDRFRGLLDWWSELEPALIRVWSFFVVSFGLALAYAWT